MAAKFRDLIWKAGGSLSLLLFVCPQGKADTISAVGGLAFGRNSGRNEIKSPSPLLGVEYTFRISTWIKFGGFYDFERFKYLSEETGRIRYRGLVLRLHARNDELSGPFVFGKLGLCEQILDEEHSRNRLAFGTGLGYQFVLNRTVSLGPQLGVRFLPESVADDARTRPIYDTSLMLSFRL